MQIPGMEPTDSYADLVASGRLTWEQADKMKRDYESSPAKAKNDRSQFLGSIAIIALLLIVTAIYTVI